ncbi:hypothetical protein CP532_5879 [Ophiocordyceps camponoti-leonardi (nom. inval.)]|nr:hypothetical protein CP532_5879 [Ophiocordyceps camponoti-leonardi (nom. inval.)]
MSREQFKVIIVGGSVTGLTLAHCLHRIGVDYTILEKRAEIVLQEGASIGIMPNGARILDQLGLYTFVEKAAASLGTSDLCFPDGFTFRSFYPRRKLLEILYSTLPDKTKVHVNKEVSRIEQDELEEKGLVRVWTADGDVYEGDVVVGADGVHSRTRAEMQRMASLSGNTKMATNPMSTEYSCCFGISSGVENLKPGTQILHMDNGRTLMLVPSRDQVVFWFCIQKLDRRYENGETPRFTSDEAVALCSQLADIRLTEKACFRDVWEKREVFNMVAIEEGVVRTWSFGRVVCIGDRANCAIEDAAVLTNLLHKSLLTKKPTIKEVENLLRRFNQIHYQRVARISDASWAVVRIHARDGLIMKFIGRYLMPYMGGKKAQDARAFKLIGDAAALNFLPLPRHSYPGWKKQGARSFRFGLAVLASMVLFGSFTMFLRESFSPRQLYGPLMSRD